MKVVGLISGGKDSCYNLLKCKQFGHEIVVLANLTPEIQISEGEHKDEIDSFMFQTVGYSVIPAIAECMGLPLITKTIQKGSSKVQSLGYVRSDPSDEVEILFELLKEVKEKYHEVNAVSCGAILSNYQRNRVESVCTRLQLTSLCYLWKRDQRELLNEMTESDINAILIKIAAMGLSRKHLGKSIKDLQPALLTLSDKYELNVCGGGGEYETLVLDCPLFIKSKIVIDSYQIVTHSNDAFAEVAFIHIDKFHLEEKKAVNTEHVLSPQIPAILPNQDIVHSEKLLSKKTNILWSFEKKSNYIKSVRVVKDYFYIDATFSKEEQLSEQISAIFSDIKSSIENIKLNSEGLSPLLFVNLYLKDVNEFENVNKEYFKHFSINPASRACIQVPMGFGYAFIECVGTMNLDSKKSLHVQSISSWAPACIGPYSQATTLGNTVFLAGQIGLYPPTMGLVKGGILSEANQIIWNLEQVMSDVDTRWEFALTCLIFVVEEIDEKHKEEILKMVLSKTNNSNNNNAEKIGRPPMVSFVKVGGLPKQASIEMLVIASTSEQKKSQSVDWPIDFSEPFRFLSRQIASNEMSIFHAFMCVNEHFEGEVKANNVVTLLIKLITNWIEDEIKTNWDNVLMVKVYHHYEIQSIDLQATIQEQIKHRHRTTVPVTCILTDNISVKSGPSFVNPGLFVEVICIN
eukprot:TRINITY_DN6993_c0_g2_i1.p1 TRINITY_DN6993_c0_g2~~TRINITY_DN6993_c0_g2_i1.p1  ORF type:complete len:703 (+),score=124.23 TRINITY_DN6993_c0_g2_i1:47-2110(+)